MLVPPGAVWKYLDDGSDQGAAWTAPGFDDSAWQSGPAQLGFGDGDEATVVSFGNATDRYITTYFRRTFDVTNSASITGLTVRVLRDDGALVYLNGVEVFRSNLPPGPVSSSTLALAAAGGADEMTNFFSGFVSPHLVVAGLNTLAVEVHQVNAASSDMSFDLELLANVASPTNPPAAPSIITQPQSQTATIGSDVAFTVEATGTPPLTYLWRRNATVVSVGSNPTLNLLNVQTNHAGIYRVMVTNLAGIAFSSNAVLQVVPGTNPVPPIIVTQPQGQTVVAGSDVTFSVVASGTPPFGYAWRFGEEFIPGATNSTFTLLNVQPNNNAGFYSVAVSNQFGTTFSIPAELQILGTNPPPLPPTIVTQPQSQTVLVGANVGFFVEVIGTPPFSYRWRRNGVTIPGATNASLNLFNVQSNQAGIYSVIVTNTGGIRASSNAVLQVLTSTNSSPSIVLLSPTNGASFVAPATILLNAAVTDPGGVVARVDFFAGTNRIALDGAAPFTQVWSNVPPGSYQVRAVAVGGTNTLATSTAVNITVGGPVTDLTLIATGSAWRYLDTGIDLGTAWTAPFFDDFSWAVGPGKLGYGDGDEATTIGFGPDAANKYITTYFRRPFFITNSASITGLTVRLLRDDGAVVYLNGVEVIRNNMPAGPVNFSTLATLTAEGSEYIETSIPASLLVAGQNSVAVEIHQQNPASSDLGFDLGLTAQRSSGPLPPTIVSQPQSRTVNAGANTSFNVVAVGAPPLIYRWRQDGTDIAVTTNGILSLVNVQPSHAGLYSVVISNFVGSVTSATARLTVVDSNRPPVAQSQNIVIGEDTPIFFQLTGSDPDGQPVTFAILTPPSHGTVSLGSPTNGFRQYRPAPEYSGPDQFTFTVSDGFLRATGVVNITVIEVNDAPIARATVSPLIALFPDSTDLVVLAPNNTAATVVLDASLSTDQENDPIEFLWSEGGEVFAMGVTVTNELAVGAHLITLVADDGSDNGLTTVAFDVLAPGDAVDDIIARLENSSLPRLVRRPLASTLESARSAFEGGSFATGVRRLEAFQRKVEMRVAPLDPQLSTSLIDAARKVIDAVSAP